MISEWSLKAAHNLDFQRDAWRAKRDSSSIAPDAVLSLLLPDNLDHALLLSLSYQERLDAYKKASKDVMTIQNYLTKLKDEKVIGGERYPKSVFRAYCMRVVVELQYRQGLTAALRHSLKVSRIMAAGKPEGTNEHVDDIFGALPRFVDAVKRNMREAYGETWFTNMSQEDQEVFDYVASFAQSLWVKRVFANKEVKP